MRDFFNADAIIGSVTNSSSSERQETSVVVFRNDEYGQIRVVMRGDEPWFVAKDVCACLDLTDTSKTVSLLDDDERGTNTIRTPSGWQEMLIVSEPGLYSLILRSRKPEAKAFKRWVTHEVLPSIRRTGSYAIAGVPVPRFDSPADAARAWADQYEARLVAEKKAVYEAARADLAIATKAQIVAGRDSYLMQQRHEDLRTIRRKDERNGKLEAMYAEQGIELGAERTRADKAEDALGRGKTYSCAMNIKWLSDYFDFKSFKPKVIWGQAGRHLSILSEEMGYEVQPVQTERYPVGSYHADVIAAWRERLDANPSLMGKYRKQ